LLQILTPGIREAGIGCLLKAPTGNITLKYPAPEMMSLNIRSPAGTGGTLNAMRTEKISITGLTGAVPEKRSESSSKVGRIGENSNADRVKKDY
jgi:hypothetical protein